MPSEAAAIVLRMPNEVFSQGRIEVIDEIMSPDIIEHMPVPPGYEGLDGFKRFVRELRAAFPDLHLDVELNFGEGDLVAAVATASGTMQGPFLGMPPTGKRATWTEAHMSRVRDGKIVEHWGVVDSFAMFAQLGLIPAAAGAPPG